MMGSATGKTGLNLIYVHGSQQLRNDPNASASVFALYVDYNAVPPAIVGSRIVATQGETIQPIGEPEFKLLRLSSGATNSLGTYATAMVPSESSDSVAVSNAPGVFRWDPANYTWTKIVRFGDPAPDGGFYGGDFGDIDLDDSDNLALVAAVTTPPHRGSPRLFAGSQALIYIPGNSAAAARTLLRTGDMLPTTAAVIQSFGLVTVSRADGGFTAQVSARRLDQAGASPATALLVGSANRIPVNYRLVAASPNLLRPAEAAMRKVTTGDVFIRAGVSAGQSSTFVTHRQRFQESAGSDDVQQLNYYSRGRSTILREPVTTSSGIAASTFGGPVVSAGGISYWTELNTLDGSSRLLISDGVNDPQVLLKSGDGVQGKSPQDIKPVTDILSGYHSTQVDSFGRLAFAAEFVRQQPADNPANIETSVVIGIPQ